MCILQQTQRFRVASGAELQSAGKQVQEEGSGKRTTSPGKLWAHTMTHFRRVGGCKPDAKNHISQHAQARPVTHFRRSGNSAPPAARRRSKATAQTAASDRRPADGAGAGRRGPRASERAGGLAPPLPALPGDLQGPSGGGGGAMFVQEEKIFAGKVLRLHICASDGAEWLEEATEDTSVEQLKERCLKQVRPAGPGLRPPPLPQPPLPDPRASAPPVPPSRATSTAREAGADRDTGSQREGAAGPARGPSSVLTGVGEVPGSSAAPAPEEDGGRPAFPAGPAPWRGVRLAGRPRGPGGGVT